MSSLATLILSSSAAATQSRCFVSPAIGTKECWWSNSEGDRLHQNANSNSVFRLLKTKTGESDGYYARANRSKTVAKAGPARYSGAIHGNSQGKSRSRRRQPGQEDEQENCDEHQEGSTSRGDDTLTTTQSREKSAESTAEADAACEALAVAEGVIDEDGSIDDDVQQLSYNRYLLELGVDTRSLRGDGDSKRELRESARNLQEAQDEISSDDNDLHLPQNGASSQAQVSTEAGGDFGDDETEESDAKRAKNLERSRGKEAERIDSVPEYELENENGSISVDRTSPVAATVSPTPDLVPKTSLFNDGEDNVFRNDGEDADSVPETENSTEFSSVSDGRNSKKKGRRKLRSKAAVDSSFNLEKRGDTEHVRISIDEAERPATPSANGIEAFPAMNWSVTVVKEAENFDQKVDFGTGKVPEKEAGVVGVLADRDSLDILVDSNSTNDTSDEKPEEELGIIADLADRDSRSAVALDVGVDSNPTSDTSNEKPEEVGIKTGIAVFPEAEFAHTDDESSFALDGVVGSNSTNDTSKEGPKEEAGIKTSSSVFAGAELVYTYGGSSVALDGVVGSYSTNDFSNEKKSPDTPLSVLGEVGSQVTEQVGQVVDQVGELAEQLGQVVDQVGDLAFQAVDVVSDVAEEMANAVNEQVELVAETVSLTASQVADHVTIGVDTVTSTASAVVEQVTDFFSSDDDEDSDSDDEFEAYVTSDLPEFRGRQGFNNFIIKQEDHGVLSKIYDFYTYMLKQSFPKFAAAMFFTPIFVSGVFTLLYLPEFEGLAFDETARDFYATAGGDIMKLHLTWKTLFQVFMFSLSLSTGLQPELAPLSPYTLIIANLNALVAQLVFVFLSGAVFARLSQPSQPLKCSTVALVSSSPAQRRRKDTSIKVFMARYVLAGPQPCELVDVKVDLTYKYNTNTRTGSYFRATQSLKLVRPEIAFLTHGMLVRHVVDDKSPLYQRTQEMLDKEDAVFCLSVVGLERASMQSVFHVQHYSVVDNDVIWDAEFEDIILINKKNHRVVDHSRLSLWRPVTH